MNRAALAAALLLAATLITACTTTTTPAQGGPAVLSPGPVKTTSTPPPRPGLTAAQALGDPRTLDPCRLTDAGRLTGGRFRAEPASPNSLDTCQLSAHISDGTDLTVFVGPLVTNPEQVGATDLGHGLRAAEPASDGTGCTGALQFADHVDLRIDAEVNGPGTVDTCGFAGQAVRIAADLAVAGPAGPAAHNDYRAGTFFAEDPCTVLPPSALATAHLAQSQPQYPQRHRCDLTLDDSDLAFPTVTLLFGDDIMPPAGNGQQTQQIDGRLTIVTSYPDGSYDATCYVQTVQGAVDGADRQVATVQVSGGGRDADTAQVCTAGTTVAAALWPRLPGSTG